MQTPGTDLRWANDKLLFVDSSASSHVYDHPQVSMSNDERVKLSTDDINRMVKLCCTEHLPSLANQDYMEKIRELNDRLDTVKNIVRPGCSYEVLNAALSYMFLLATVLSEMPQKKLQASL